MGVSKRDMGLFNSGHVIFLCITVAELVNRGNTKNLWLSGAAAALFSAFSVFGALSLVALDAGRQYPAKEARHRNHMIPDCNDDDHRE
jgi:hypothetical protein